MRIVIDMQGAQGHSQYRGVGRYILALAQAIALNRGPHEIILALTSQSPLMILEIRRAFENILPQENIRVWHFHGIINYERSRVQNFHDRRVAELLWEGFITSLYPDIVLVGHLFEGLDDDMLPSIRYVSNLIPTAVILHDLIPLVYSDFYLRDPLSKEWYYQQLKSLRRATLLLAVSEFSRQEGHQLLSFPPEQSATIHAGVDPKFRPITISAQQKEKLLQKYKLSRPFLMYTGGCDFRKNLGGLIRAYAKLPKHLLCRHQLVIVCALPAITQEELRNIAQISGLDPTDCILTGFISDEDLIELYNLCKAFVFPSWAEGFGLPVLEAMACGKAVIAARSSSLPEIIDREDALFESNSEEAITQKLEKLLTNQEFLASLEEYGLERSKNFSWGLSAKKTISAFELLLSKLNTNRTTFCLSPQRLRIAFISPLPPNGSRIALYSAAILPELSRYYEIDVITDQQEVSDPWIKANCQTHSIEWFMLHSCRYERVLYQFANVPLQQHLLTLLDKIPGVVILHEFFLSNFLAQLDFSGLYPGLLFKETYRSHGYSALIEEKEFLLSSKLPLQKPCNLRILQQSLNIIVHSEKDLFLANHYYGANASHGWTVIPSPRSPLLNIDKSKARAALKLQMSSFIVCGLVSVDSRQRENQLIHAWESSVLAHHENCLLIVVRSPINHSNLDSLPEIIHDFPHDQRIRVIENISSQAYYDLLAAADIGVLLVKSHEELLEENLDCMNYSLPIITNMDEACISHQKDIVWQIENEFQNAELVQALEILWKSPSTRIKLSKQAKNYMLSQHNPRICGDKLYQALETMYRRKNASPYYLVKAVSHIHNKLYDLQEQLSLAQAIALSQPSTPSQKQLIIDISSLMKSDSHTSFHYNLPALLQKLLKTPPQGYRIEPVYFHSDGHCYYARTFIFNMLGYTQPSMSDAIIEYRAGDVFLGISAYNNPSSVNETFYRLLSIEGIKTLFVLYSTGSKHFPNEFSSWMNVLIQNNTAICISQDVAETFAAWADQTSQTTTSSLVFSCFDLHKDGNISPSSIRPVYNDPALLSYTPFCSFTLIGTASFHRIFSSLFRLFGEVLAKYPQTHPVLTKQDPSSSSHE